MYYAWMQSDNNRSLHSVLQSMECIKKHVTLFLCITDILCGKLYPTKHPVPITVSSQLKKSVASLLPCPVWALTKSAKLWSSYQPTAALCCAVVCTPCQGTDSSPSLTQKNTTMLYNNTVMDFCFKNDWMHCQKKCLFFDFFRCYFGRKNEKSQNLFSTKIFRKMQSLVRRGFCMVYFPP